MKGRYAMHRAASFLLLALPAFGQAPFSWKDLGGGRVELSEGDKPALVYNYGPQWKQGAPQDRRRCCYIFPVYTPAGVSMLDDFPEDHWHHRGLFWSWPVVETGGKTYDLWMTFTAAHRSVKAPVTSGGHFARGELLGSRRQGHREGRSAPDGIAGSRQRARHRCGTDVGGAGSAGHVARVGGSGQELRRLERTLRGAAGHHAAGGRGSAQEGRRPDSAAVGGTGRGLRRQTRGAAHYAGPERPRGAIPVVPARVRLRGGLVPGAHRGDGWIHARTRQAAHAEVPRAGEGCAVGTLKAGVLHVFHNV